MKNKKIRKQWEDFIEKYKQYFLSNEEKWYDKLEQVKKYIDENKKRPSNKNKNPEIKLLGIWIGH